MRCGALWRKRPTSNGCGSLWISRHGKSLRSTSGIAVTRVRNSCGPICRRSTGSRRRFIRVNMPSTQGSFRRRNTKPLRSTPAKPIISSASIPACGSASPASSVTRWPSLKTWRTTSVPSNTSSAITTSPGLQHYLYNTTDPCVIVICGIAGDLSRTTLIPSLYALACQHLLPEPCAILGVGRRPWNDDALRQEMRPFVQDRKDFSPAAWDQFAQRLHFVSGDFSAPASEAYATLRTQIAQVQRRDHIPDNVLCHLSWPPPLYGEIVSKLGAASLLQSPGGWRRIIIE